jgi:hypothetical protein
MRSTPRQNLLGVAPACLLIYQSEWSETLWYLCCQVLTGLFGKSTGKNLVAEEKVLILTMLFFYSHIAQKCHLTKEPNFMNTLPKIIMKKVGITGRRANK